MVLTYFTEMLRLPERARPLAKEHTMPNHMPPQTGWEMTEPRVALTAFLSSLPNMPQLLALGEPAHGVDAFPAWRNRVFRTLVEHHAYRSIAIESDVLAGLRVDAYVMSGQETLGEIMHHGFSYGFGKVKANRELLAWMRGFNAGRDEADRVRFYGFDAPTENMWAASPRHSLLTLHAYLAEQLPDLPIDESTITRLCGDDARWTNQAAAVDATQSVGADEDAKRLRWLADELLMLLEAEWPAWRFRLMTSGTPACTPGRPWACCVTTLSWQTAHPTAFHEC